MTPETPDDQRFRNILVGTDFSANASAALQWALAVTAGHDARITLVHALGPVSRRRATEAREEVARHLREHESAVEQARVPVESRTARGRPWEVIGEIEREIGADLIVIGSRGHTAYSRLLLGRTADRIIRSATAPVLTVHPEDAGRELLVRHVLVATDFSPASDLALEAARRLLGTLAAEEKGRLVLLHACDFPVEYGIAAGAQVVAEARAEEEAAAAEQLATIADRVRSDLGDVATVVRQGYPAAVIEEMAGSERVDLIALGTQGRIGLPHLLLGSVAERVLHHAPCPVITVRGPSREGG